MKKGTTYHFWLSMVVASLLLSCERIEPVDVGGLDGPMISMKNPGIIRMDTSSFSFLAKLDGKHGFDIHGTPDLPKEGDIVYYYNSDKQVFGEIGAVNTEGQSLWLTFIDIPLNRVFDYIALKNDLSQSPEVFTGFLSPLATFNSDSIFFEQLEFFWDFGDGVWGLLNLDSLLVLNEPMGIQQFYLGPHWKEETGFHRIDFNLKQVHQLSSSIDLVAKGEFAMQDSLKLRSRLLGPYFADSFPVYYLFDEWLKIDFSTSGDNSFKTNFKINGISDISARYEREKSWNISENIIHRDENFDNIDWSKLNSYEISLSLRTSFIPVFCGKMGLELSLVNEWKTTGNVEWPSWSYSSVNSLDMSIDSDFGLFESIIFSGLNQNLLSREVLSDNGQLENHSPEADFSISPAAGYTDTNFKFDASKSSDLEDEPSQLQVRWDFEGDEIWETNFSYNKEAFHIYDVPGNYIVIMEVMDTQGAVTPKVKSVVVQETSSAPVPVFTVSPEAGRTSDIFIFDASGSYDREDDVSQLKVRWDFKGNGEWDTEFSTVKADFFPFPEPGTYYSKLEVKDTQGLTASTTREVRVEAANIKPTAIFTVDPEKGDINTFFHFDASGSSDVEDDASLLRVRWDFENDGTWNSEYRTIKTINHRFPTANTYTVVLQVMDTDDFSTLFSMDVVVSNPNTRPTAAFTISPSTGDTTTIFTFDARDTEDLEDSIEELVFRWDWENDGIYDTEFSFSPLVEKTFETSGTKLIKMEVKDSGGLTHTKTDLLIVN